MSVSRTSSNNSRVKSKETRPKLKPPHPLKMLSPTPVRPSTRHSQPRTLLSIENRPRACGLEKKKQSLERVCETLSLLGVCHADHLSVLGLTPAHAVTLIQMFRVELSESGTWVECLRLTNSQTHRLTSLVALVGWGRSDAKFQP